MSRKTKAKEMFYEVLARYHWSEHTRNTAPALVSIMGDDEISLGKFRSEGNAHFIARRELLKSPFESLCDSIEVRVEASLYV